MKILIAADMEGITGVTNWEQVTPGHSEYPRFRKLMTEDVNAAVRGCFDAGADEVLVTDGHEYGANILIEELDPRARLNSGSPSPRSMMEGIDETVSAVFFVGYHARNGSADAILDHTWSSRSVANIWINDLLTGEYGLNAALAGHFAVPVILVTGDQTACAQTQELLGDLETVVVKRAVGRFAAECLTPAVTREMIYQASSRAVTRLKQGRAPNPFVVDSPVEIRIEFFTSELADRAGLLINARRAGAMITLHAENMPDAYSSFRAAVNLAGQL